MADCELCTLAKPTLVPIKVQVHTLPNPEGAYKGVCTSCLDSLEAAYQERFGKAEEKK
ncbi:MAG: F420H2 dehydrogenase subunit FpoO [Methanotrichaceae archaeon]|nr:F420H2 dehydrogenase subunit FpoO [Methanotrichaceae archaeon]